MPLCIDFFGIAETGVNSCNLIDRINLFFKEQDGVEFSDEEKVFVDRADKLETEDEVLDLAEELYKYMEDNPETDKHDDGESAPSDTVKIMVEKLLMILVVVLIMMYGDLVIILVLMHLEMM